MLVMQEVKIICTELAASLAGLGLKAQMKMKFELVSR